MPVIEDPRSSRATARSPMWLELAEFARTHPGQWVRTDERIHNGTMAAGAIKKGTLAAFRPAGDYEAVSRVLEATEDPLDTYVFVRFVGELLSRT